MLAVGESAALAHSGEVCPEMGEGRRCPAVFSWQMSLNEISVVLWAFATADWCAPTLFATLSSRLIASPEETTNTARGVAMVNIAWAAVKMCSQSRFHRSGDGTCSRTSP